MRAALIAILLFSVGCGPVATEEQPVQTELELKACDLAPHGSQQERIRFLGAEVPVGESCRQETQQRTCLDGSWTPWSGSYPAETCSEAPASCGDTAHGDSESRIRYLTDTPQPGESCQAETQQRSCTAGSWSSWSGSYVAESCGGQAPLSYSWETSAWDTCSEECGGGLQERLVICRASDGGVVSDEHCSESKPAEEQACNQDACAPQWDCRFSNAQNASSFVLHGTTPARLYYWQGVHLGTKDGTDPLVVGSLMYKVGAKQSCTTSWVTLCTYQICRAAVI